MTPSKITQTAAMPAQVNGSVSRIAGVTNVAAQCPARSLSNCYLCQCALSLRAAWPWSSQLTCFVTLLCGRRACHYSCHLPPAPACGWIAAAYPWIALPWAAHALPRTHCACCRYCGQSSACTDGRCPGAGSMCNMCGCEYLCDSCGFCGRKLLMGA